MSRFHERLIAQLTWDERLLVRAGQYAQMADSARESARVWRRYPAEVERMNDLAENNERKAEQLLADWRKARERIEA